MNTRATSRSILAPSTYLAGEKWKEGGLIGPSGGGEGLWGSQSQWLFALLQSVCSSPQEFFHRFGQLTAAGCPAAMIMEWLLKAHLHILVSKHQVFITCPETYIYSEEEFASVTQPQTFLQSFKRCYYFLHCVL